MWLILRDHPSPDNVGYIVRRKDVVFLAFCQVADAQGSDGSRACARLRRIAAGVLSRI